MNNYCRFFNIINIYNLKQVILMNDCFHKIIQKNCNYFSFFMHVLLCNIFVLFMFCFASLTVIAGKEIDLLESKKKNYYDKNIHIAIYDSSKSCKNNMIFSENNIVFYPWKNDVLKLLGKNISIPCSLVKLIKIMPLEQESLFLKKIILFDVYSMTQENLCLFNFFYKIEHLYSFLMHDDKDIKFIMNHVYYASIVEVFRFYGFPSVAVVEHVKTWVDLKKGYTLDWLWKNLSLHFKEQGVPNKHVFFSLIAEMEKEIELPNEILNYLSEFENHWFLSERIPKNCNKDDWCMVKKKLNNFFSFLFSQNITISKLFITQMKYFDLEKMILFCDKCKCFYENRQEIWSISSLFLRSTHATETLLKYNNEDIKFIATHPFYKNILVIYRRCEFPPATMVREVDTWVNLREGITPVWIWNNLSFNFKASEIPEKKVFFSSVAHVTRNIYFIRCYQIIKYGLKQEKRDNNQKCSDAYNKKNVDKAHDLLMLLARKKIDNPFSFINIVLELDTDKIADFCDKIIYFYSKAKETRSIIPIFLDSMEKVYLFLENSYEDIEFIAQHSAYLFIAEVYFGVNFPVASCVKKADTWKRFVGGEDVSLITLWILLEKMCTHCGVPTKEEFLLRCLESLHTNYNFHEKNKKEKLTVKKRKLSSCGMFVLLSSSIDILNNVESKNKINDDGKLNDICSKKSKEKIGELLIFLMKKRIENIALFYELILELDDNIMADFCDKIMHFYSNTEEKKSIVLSFLNSIEKVNLFLMNTNEEIEFIARHPCYAEIYKVYYAVCFPSASCVKKFDTWENVVENITLVLLWKLLAKLFPGCGVPKRGTFLFDWFELSYKQHKICKKEQKNEFTLQEKKLNFDNAMLSLSFNTDMLNAPKIKNKIINNQRKTWIENWDEKIINKIHALLMLLENKNIEDIPSFMNIILQLKNNSIIIFCSNMMLFYLNNEEKKSIVTLFLNSMKKVNVFIHKNTKKNIKFIAQHPHYLYIVEVYRGVNFPDACDVKEIESWKEVTQEKTSIFLWKLLAKTCAGYGVPSKEMFLFLCSCCYVFCKKK